MSGTTLFGNDVGQELHLSLSTAQSTDTALDEFTCTFVLMNVERREYKGSVHWSTSSEKRKGRR